MCEIMDEFNSDQHSLFQTNHYPNIINPSDNNNLDQVYNNNNIIDTNIINTNIDNNINNITDNISDNNYTTNHQYSVNITENTASTENTDNTNIDELQKNTSDQIAVSIINSDAGSGNNNSDSDDSDPENLVSHGSPREIERIRYHVYKNDKLYFRVKWKNFKLEETLSVDDIIKHKRILRSYLLGLSKRALTTMFKRQDCLRSYLYER